MKEKKPSSVQLLLRTVVKDPDGKIISDSGLEPARSFVLQFLEFIRYLFYGGGAGVKATATDGSEDNIYYNASPCNGHFYVDAPATAEYGSNWGIVVGTGDTPVTNTDYKLETRLLEGVGAGNINHGDSTVGVAAVVGANVDLTINRSFSNNTGSAITVKEVGMYSRFKGGGAPASGFYHCIIRDVLVAPVNVPDKCTLTVYYTIRTTV